MSGSMSSSRSMPGIEIAAPNKKLALVLEQTHDERLITTSLAAAPAMIVDIF